MQLFAVHFLLHPMSLTPPTSPVDDSALLIVEPPARFGLTTKTVKPTVHRVGVSQDGEWYLYGLNAKTKNRTPVEALGLPRFRGQVDRSHAMTLRLSIDDQPNQDQAPVHASAEAGGY